MEKKGEGRGKKRQEEPNKKSAEAPLEAGLLGYHSQVLTSS